MGMSQVQVSRREKKILKAVAYINTGYTVLTDTAVVPNFITQEQLEMMKEAAAEYNTGHNY